MIQSGYHSMPKSDLIDMIVKYGQLKYLEGRCSLGEERRGYSKQYQTEALLKLEQIEDIIYNEL